ncbi:hypothetical protein MBLNU459_g5743t2 [Dothideomycetes sp. NU459]
MITLLSPHFVQEPVTENDLVVASLCWGFTLGFGFLTVWTAIKQTRSVSRRHGASRLNTPYVWMIWLEILVCLSFSIICWMYIRGYIAPSFAFYFCILTTWALQVQFLLQIIINRVSVLLVDRRKALHLKIFIAVLITAINISVYCIWIPARLQTSETYIHINKIWDRCEKIIYLIVDALLNWYFIRIVRRNLVKPGLKKYNPLVRFNQWIIVLSLSMDVLIIGTMSLKNSFVYMQFHPLAYIVKLNIEMSMAELIASVSRSSNNAVASYDHTGQSNDEHLRTATATGSDNKVGVKSDLKAFGAPSFNSSSPGSEATAHYANDSGDEHGEVELRDLSSTRPELKFAVTPRIHKQDISAEVGPSNIGFSEDASAAGPNGFVVHRKDEVCMEISRPSKSSAEGSVDGFDDRQGRGATADTMPLRKKRRSLSRPEMGMQTDIWGPY